MPVYRVPATLSWTGVGAPGVNVWSFRGSIAAPDQGALLDAGLAALNTFYTAISEWFPPGMSVTIGADIVDRETQTDHSRGTQVINSSAGGTIWSAPKMLAIVIGWKTTLKARRGMGRTFLGPLNNNCMESNGTPNATCLADIGAAATALRDASTAANDWAFGVWGLEAPGNYDATGKLLPDQPRVHRDFTSFKIRDTLGVMRSRRD